MNLQEHPAHIHVNHFQLVTIDASDAIYFQVGDWHDTIQDGSDDATVRMQTDTFTGGMIVHCQSPTWKYIASDASIVTS